MSILDQSVAKLLTLTDMQAVRDEAVAMYKQGKETIEAAEHKLQELGVISLPWESRPRACLEDTVKKIDGAIWRLAFDRTGFMKLMDMEARAKFLKDVDDKPPVFCQENIRATFLQLHQEADAMFVRGVVNVFRKLSTHHVTNTNEPFKINRRAILEYMLSPRWSGGLELRHCSYRDPGAYMNDLDRVFRIIDGRDHQPHALQNAINTAMADGSVYEDEYFHVKGFRNGNMHLKFMRADLLDKANKMIGDYYNGNALAADRQRAA